MDLVDATNDMNYVVRGARVVRMEKHEIRRYAIGLCRALNLKNSAARSQSILQVLECSLLIDHKFPLNIDPIEDNSWTLDGVEAICDPASLTICMPNSLYTLAAQNDPTALRILFHELGHIFLMHKPLLHHSSSSNRVKEEDSEWQADMFADIMMGHLLHQQNPIQQQLF